MIQVKKRHYIMLTIVFLLILAVARFIWSPMDFFYLFNKPYTTQFFYQGTITEINKVGSRVDGKKIMYNIRLDIEGVEGAITKDTTIYKIIEIDDPQKTFIKTREEAAIEDLRIGQKVDVWTRLANDHLMEAYDITIIE